MIIDSVYPNYIFTTVLDVDFDSQQYHCYKKNRVVSRLRLDCNSNSLDTDTDAILNQRPELPAYLQPSRQLKSTTTASESGADNYLEDKDKATTRHLHKRRVEVRA